MKFLSIMASVALASSIWVAAPASAATVNVMIGDNDGFGEGVADNGDLVNIGDFPKDFRSGAEKSATNGAEQTDINSALYPPLGSPYTFFFNFSGKLTSAVLTLDIGGVQDLAFGDSTLAYFNGVLQDGLLAYDRGAFGSNVLQFVLDGTQLARANLDGFFSLTLDRNGNIDAIAIDYLRLQGVSTVPLPAGLPLLLAGLGGLAVLRRKSRKVA